MKLLLGDHSDSIGGDVDAEHLTKQQMYIGETRKLEERAFECN